MTLLLSPRGILSNRNLPKMVTEERKIKARGQTTFAPLALFTSTRFCWDTLPLNHFPVVPRSHVLVGRVVDGLVDEMDTSICKGKLCPRRVLRTEAP